MLAAIENHPKLAFHAGASGKTSQANEAIMEY